MKEIAGFVYDRMQRDNDCWVSAAIMIYNCMRSDKIDRTNRIIQDDPNFRNGQMGSASDLLWKLGIKNYVYTTARFPTREQIGKYIDKNKPFLCCVGADYSGRKPDIAYQGGHSRPRPERRLRNDRLRRGGIRIKLLGKHFVYVVTYFKLFRVMRIRAGAITAKFIFARQEPSCASVY